MRVVDMAAQILVLLRNAPNAQGYIEDAAGKRFYVSPANPTRHIHPSPDGSSVAKKVTIGDL